MKENGKNNVIIELQFNYVNNKIMHPPYIVIFGIGNSIWKINCSGSVLSGELEE